MRIIDFGIKNFQGQIQINYLLNYKNAIAVSSIYTNATIPYNTAKKVRIFLKIVIKTITIKNKE